MGNIFLNIQPIRNDDFFLHLLKVKYFISHFASSQDLELFITFSLQKLHLLSDKEIIELLTQIKGVGSWTVEMLLMFSLGREDVFAVDDLGIQQAMAKLYKIEVADKKAMKQQMISIANKWSPYKTYACLHLWAWKDNEQF